MQGGGQPLFHRAAFPTFAAAAQAGFDAVEFLFPRRDQVTTTSWFSYRGGGTFAFTFAALDACAGPGTAFDDLASPPGTLVAFPPVHMEPGHAYAIDVGPCAQFAGKCVAGSE